MAKLGCLLPLEEIQLKTSHPTMIAMSTFLSRAMKRPAASLPQKLGGDGHRKVGPPVATFFHAMVIGSARWQMISRTNACTSTTTELTGTWYPHRRPVKVDEAGRNGIDIWVSL